MRIGVLCTVEELASMRALGFRAAEWVRFAETPAAQPDADWKPYADQLRAETASLDLRISALGAQYANPLDPPQRAGAVAIFRRAIEVAAYLGIPVVSGFAGAVIQTRVNERGGNPMYEPLERFLPELISFWEPLAAYAKDHGIKLAFEHCPQGVWHLPVMGYNMLAQPAIWERFFDAAPWDNVGLEWDASHLVCQFIDPVENIRRFGSRIFHVHAKDARVNRHLLELYGICHPGVVEHRFVGLGQSDWSEIVHMLMRVGYTGDLSIEGRHDPVYRDHGSPAPDDVSSTCSLAGRKWEAAGLLLAKRTLEVLIPPEDGGASH
jgi:sugar phosphate isomerase/epimerase